MALFRRRNPNPSTPAAVEQAITAQGLDLSGNFGPGRPVNPWHGYSTGARAFDYPQGVNVTVKPRVAYGRPTFDTLKRLIDAWDLARICINHKVDDLRSMELLFTPMEGFEGDVATAIRAARAALAYPDRELPYEAWLSKWLEDVWRYDAGCLYRRRNRAGEVIGLEVVDGKTILPYIDEYGRRPLPPAPAFAQIIRGTDYEWLTSDDLIYVPFRPQTDSPYGLAPIESIILTANTDLRFQKYFLDYFTAGSMPGGLLEAPADASTPDQVGEWQDYWDALMLGDQEALRQIKVVPNGMKLDPQREATFDENFPIYLMRRCCAAFGVTPQDLGITMDVNRANGDTQVDIQFRVNTLPPSKHVGAILTRYVQQDLGLPVRVRLDDGQEKEDRLNEAKTWQTYVEMGAASPDEAREELLGLPIDNERPFPRGIVSSRLGFIPLTAILNISGAVDPETAAPEDDQPLALETFDGTPGLLPYKPPGGSEFKRAPLNPDEPDFPALERPVPGTGVEQPGAPDTVHASSSRVAKERQAFQRFVKARGKSGRWRDFAFTDVPAGEARELNKTGRAVVRKDAGQIVAAGLCVVAGDTGRVLLLQRAPGDGPASGLWELPGGHLEDGETAKQAAYREWQEETGILLPYVVWEPDVAWTAGCYQAFIWTVPAEFDVADRGAVINPDDPDGDYTEAIAWWDPTLVGGNPAVRPELAGEGDLLVQAVTAALAADVVKAGGSPKGWRGDAADTPHAAFDLAITDHYSPQILAALRALWPRTALTAAVTAAVSEQSAEAALLALPPADLTALREAVSGLLADSWTAGSHAAVVQTGMPIPEQQLTVPDWDQWTPGHVQAADLASDGGFQAMLEQADIRLAGIADSTARLIGDRIADGLRTGQSVSAIARTLLGHVASADRAEMVTHTETARAMSQASLAVYRQSGVGQWDLVTSPGACPICLGVAAANPHPVTDTADLSPLHPRCRCAPSPVTS